MKTRFQVPPGPIKVPLEELKKLQEVDAMAAYKELMRFVLLKREQLEQDVREYTPKDKESPMRVDNEVRKWVTETGLHTLVMYKPRDVRRRVEILERQKLVFRKKLRISPDLPDPVPKVEAAVEAWMVQRDAQMVVRKSKALMRKARKQYILTQKAERYAMIAEGRIDVDEYRRQRILEHMERRMERKREIEAKKRLKAEKKAARTRGETDFDAVFNGVSEVPTKPPSNEGSSKEPAASVWAPADDVSRFQAPVDKPRFRAPVGGPRSRRTRH